MFLKFSIFIKKSKKIPFKNNYIFVTNLQFCKFLLYKYIVIYMLNI